MKRPPPISTVFPSTTLFRSLNQELNDWSKERLEEKTAVSDIVKSYIEKVAAGKWDQATVHLSGGSLNRALKIVAEGNRLKMNISDLRIEALDGDGNSAFIMANYRVKVLENENMVNLIFYLEKIDGQWQIFDITEG